MGITISIYLTSSTCILFISLMQSVNGTQFLNIIFFLLVLFAATSSAAVLLTVIFTLLSIYTSL